MIKKGLENYLKWAAHDGVYGHLSVVPNIFTEQIDTDMPGERITQYMQSRMRHMASLQRRYLRGNRRPDFWEEVQHDIWWTPGKQRKRTRSKSKSPMSVRSSVSGARELDIDLFPTERRLYRSPGRIYRNLAREARSPRRNLRSSENDTYDPKECQEDGRVGPKSAELSPYVNGDDHLDNSSNRRNDIGESWDKPVERCQSIGPSEYRWKPPVVYGLFILKTSVFLLTIDSGKGDDAYVSFHVEVNFQDQHQGVWNALTIAIAVCMARDEFMTRKDDFEELPVEPDSDPDA